jgi:hypothetical protein
MGERERVVAQNESIFRDVNELQRATVRQPTATRAVTFFCECANVACEERVRLRPSDYEAVRADPRQFFVLEGHEQLEAEEVVGNLGEYLVVRKTGEAGDVAKELDSRAPQRGMSDLLHQRRRV